MWNLVWSPVRFFDARRRRHADWVTALAAPALCAGLQSVSASIFSGKIRPILDTALARLDLPLTGLPSGHLVVAMSALSYPMYFGLLTLAVLALDVLTNNSGQPARLTELTALSFYTQVMPNALQEAVNRISEELFTIVHSPAGTSALTH